jgi:hypothetical protein
METDSVGIARRPCRVRPGSIPPINSHPIDPRFHQIPTANPSSTLCHRRTATPQPRPNQLRVDLLQVLSPSLVPSSSPQEHWRLPSMTASPARDTPSSLAAVAAHHSLEVRKTVSPHCLGDVGGSIKNRFPEPLFGVAPASPAAPAKRRRRHPCCAAISTRYNVSRPSCGLRSRLDLAYPFTQIESRPLIKRPTATV